MGTEQQFCLKWNNHRSTLFSVFDNLLEEESLVDVTLSAEGQFLRAHRVILSACSPYFRSLFRSSFLSDKHPVVFMKDVDFENLKALVEYMYKGEANVPQHMLPSFIKTAESLQIRGLAECATKQLEADQQILTSSAPSSTAAAHGNHQQASPLKKRGSSSSHSAAALAAAAAAAAAAGAGPGGILAARLAKMGDAPPPMFDFDSFAGVLPRAGHAPGSFSTPPMKKSRKSSEPRPRTGSPIKEATKKLKAKSANIPGGQQQQPPNNNNYDHEEGVLKIDEDAEATKENRHSPATSGGHKMDPDDDIADMDNSNGVCTDDEEEPSMPGPGEPTGIINPWTGEQIQLSEDHEDNSAQDDTGLNVGWPNMLGDFSETAHSPLPPSLTSSAAATPSPTAAAAAVLAGTAPSSGTPVNQQQNSPGTGRPVPRLKRLNNAQQGNVFTLCQTADGVKYRCSACSRCFNLKCTLLRHVRHQHQGRFVPHPCGQCGQVFKRTDHLKVHMKKIHNMSSSSRAARASASNTSSPAVAAAVASMANQQPIPDARPADNSEEEQPVDPSPEDAAASLL